MEKREGQRTELLNKFYEGILCPPSSTNQLNAACTAWRGTKLSLQGHTWVNPDIMGRTSEERRGVTSLTAASIACSAISLNVVHLPPAIVICINNRTIKRNTAIAESIPGRSLGPCTPHAFWRLLPYSSHLDHEPRDEYLSMLITRRIAEP